MDLVNIVAALAVLQFVVFSFLVGRARIAFGVDAPAVQGHEQFERVFRVQMNTLEQIICFLPSLLLANVYWSDTFVALVGVVYLIGRQIYRQTYIADPSKRTVGFLLTIVPTFVLLFAALIGAVKGQ
ncbi:MAG: MAPEG family protein [Granulosicoccus sp.]